MKDFTLEELQARVAKGKERLRARQTAHYDLAKSLGFSGNEAAILQNQSEATIRRLAQEKTKKEQTNV